jgi:hypothetical protein
MLNVQKLNESTNATFGNIQHHCGVINTNIIIVLFTIIVLYAANRVKGQDD